MNDVSLCIDDRNQRVNNHYNFSEEFCRSQALLTITKSLGSKPGEFCQLDTVKKERKKERKKKERKKERKKEGKNEKEKKQRYAKTHLYCYITVTVQVTLRLFGSVLKDQSRYMISSAAELLQNKVDIVKGMAANNFRSDDRSPIQGSVWDNQILTKKIDLMTDQANRTENRPLCLGISN